jgi:thiol-disulfide isomerase/thioredoxin
MHRSGAALLAAMTPGIAVLAAALVIALTGGVGWRRFNGRMRNVAARPGRLEARQGAGLAVRLEAGHLQVGGTETAGDPVGDMQVPGAATGRMLTSDRLGHPLGDRATLVQISSAFCAPCRATRRILADVAGMTEGVAYVEIDAGSRLDLVRDLNVLRTPTVLVLASDGRIVRRASGQPRKPDVIAAIGAAVGP